MLRHLTVPGNEDSQVLALASLDEKSIPALAQHFKLKEKHEGIFAGGKEFRVRFKNIS